MHDNNKNTTLSAAFPPLKGAVKKAAVIVQDLRVHLPGETVLDNVSFSLSSNEHLAIMGASGSGKSTLARAFAGKIFYEGKIRYPLYKDGIHGKAVVLVDQRYSFKNLSSVSDFYYQQRFNSCDSQDAPTIMEELLHALPPVENKIKTFKKIEVLLERLGMTQRKSAPLIQLSSGEHKRFQLIKALLNPPQLLILDSPFVGLDTQSQIELEKILNELASKGTQLIVIPGAHPLPECITHIATLENKTLKSFEEKRNYSINDKAFQHPAISRFNTELLPLEKKDYSFQTAVAMKNVQITYGEKTIIKQLNWRVQRGERWLIKGRNGAGKSSLLSLINGDHPQAYANDIYLFDKKRGTGETIWEIKQKIGYVSPELHAYFDKNITCYQAIGSGFFDTIGLYKKLSAKQENLIQQWLDFLHLSHVQTKPLHSISSGLQRLTLLSRALVKSPPLLVLDEPCQGLDEAQKAQFLSLIDHICHVSKKTLVYVSHEKDEIPRCIQNVLQLSQAGHTIYSINEQPATLVLNNY